MITNYCILTNTGYGDQNTQSQKSFVEVNGNKCIEPEDVCLDKKGFFGNLEATKYVCILSIWRHEK